MTELTEAYWQEISAGLEQHVIDVQRFILHVEEDALRQRIDNDPEVGPSTFRHQHVMPYFQAAEGW